MTDRKEFKKLPGLLGNIKIEPGTSALPPGKKLPGLLGNIKIEPGTSALPPGRLASFRGARDLTLGALAAGKTALRGDSKSRKLYTPNLNVQRNKNKELVKVKEEHPRGRDNKRGRGRGEWKPGRGRAANNLIQLSGGIFSEGTAFTDRRREGRGGGGGGDRDSGSGFIPRPKLNLQHERKFDREEEELKLRELLRDDFVDDPGMDPDGSNCPIELPLLKSEVAVKKEAKKEVKLLKEGIVVDGVKIKQEKGSEEDEPAVKVKVEKEDLREDEEETSEVTVADLLKNKTPQLLFLQLPDCMPGLRGEVEPAPTQSSTSTKPTSTSSTPASAAAVADTTPQYCTLGSLTEGCIGKLQVLRSGKARLVLGNTILHVNMGTQVGFRQDLVSVNLDTSSRTGDMINLGAVQTRLSCSPDWETMLMRPRA